MEPLPTYFVERPEVFPKLKARILSQEDIRSGVLVITAIQGPGGIGKTILARAIAHDPETQERFSDGIFWATLDRKPEILTLLSTWIAALGDRDYRPTTPEAARDHLRTLLYNKSALLIVDDAWQTEHACFFQVGGPNCRMIVTTRRAEIANALGARPQQIEIFTPEQSLQLLAARLDRPITGEEQASALALAEEVGHLPLALDLIASRVSNRVSWARLTRAFREEVARLEVLDPIGHRTWGQTRLEAMFGVSLNALREEWEEAWKAFIRLGAIPKDAVVGAPMAATLWNVETKEADEILEYLWKDSLLLSGPIIQIDEEEWRGYRLHDLTHDIACRLIGKAPPEGLGSSISEAQSQFLERYAWKLTGRTLESAEWHRLEDDGYIHEHLFWHLEQLDRLDLAMKLLREETKVGENGWYTARERLGQSAGFLEDLASAWRMADRCTRQELDEGQPVEALGLLYRIALIRGSLNSMVANIPAELLKQLVSVGIWTPTQGLSYARRSGSALGRIACYLPESLLPKALESVQTILLEGDRSNAIVGIVPHLPESLLPNALEAAQSISEESFRARALAGISSHLSRSLLVEALEAARSILDEFSRAQALAGIVPHLPEMIQSIVLSEALKAARSISNEYYCSQALAEIASRFASLGDFDQAFEIAQSIFLYIFRAQALTEIAPYLPKPLLISVLEAVRSIPDLRYRAQALADISPHFLEPLQSSVLSEALEIARWILDERYQAGTLAEIIPRLPEHLLYKALESIRSMVDEHSRMQSLSKIALQFATLGNIDKAQEVARSIIDESIRSQSLIKVASYLSEPLRSSVISEALEVARSILYISSRVQVLANIAPWLPNSLLTEIIEAAQSIPTESNRAQILASIAPQLPKDLLPKALEVARSILDEYFRANTLSMIAFRLPEPFIFEALKNAQSISNELIRAHVLAEIAPHLPEADQSSVLSEALEVTWSISNESRAIALSRITPLLSKQLLSKAKEIAYSISHESQRSGALAKITLRFATLGAFDNALNIARSIEIEYFRVQALVELVPYLPETLQSSVLSEALEETRRIPDESGRAQALVRIAPQFPDIQYTVLSEALDAIQEISDVDIRAFTLAWIAPHLPERYLHNILDAARSISNESFQAQSRAIARIASCFAALGAFENALEVARSISYQDSRASALEGIVPHLPEPLLHDALEIARLSSDKFFEDQAQVGIAHRFAAIGAFDKAFEVARSILYEDFRSKALVGVILYISPTPDQQGYGILKELLVELCFLRRKYVLQSITNALPLIAGLGGENALREVFLAILDVGRWWS